MVVVGIKKLRPGFYRPLTDHETRKYVRSAEKNRLHPRRRVIPLPLCALLARQLHCR
jgi:hypothetical protein